MVKTHYDNLQVTRNASPEVIKGAYKYLAQKWHPDKNLANKDKAARVLLVINRAHEVLSDPHLRKKHDDWIARQESDVAASKHAPIPDVTVDAHAPSSAPDVTVDADQKQQNEAIQLAWRAASLSKQQRSRQHIRSVGFWLPFVVAIIWSFAYLKLESKDESIIFAFEIAACFGSIAGLLGFLVAEITRWFMPSQWQLQREEKGIEDTRVNLVYAQKSWLGKFDTISLSKQQRSRQRIRTVGFWLPFVVAILWSFLYLKLDESIVFAIAAFFGLIAGLLGFLVAEITRWFMPAQRQLEREEKDIEDIRANIRTNLV